MYSAIPLEVLKFVWVLDGSKVRYSERGKEVEGRCTVEIVVGKNHRGDIVPGCYIALYDEHGSIIHDANYENPHISDFRNYTVIE